MEATMERPVQILELFGGKDVVIHMIALCVIQRETGMTEERKQNV